LKFSSILKKGLNFINLMGLRRYRVANNFFYVGDKNDIPSIHKVVLYFPDYEYMHFGDHMFFEPSSRFLKSKGFDVKVMPTKAMEFYFINSGIKIATEDDVKEADLLITRPEFFNSVKGFKKNILYIDTASSEIKKYICQDIVEKISNFLLLSCDGFYAKPYKILTHRSEIALDKGFEYILFSNYIDSGFHRVTKWHYDRLSQFAKKMAKESNLKVIHIGTAKDKAKDNRIYDFISMDLRGKTSPEDLFYLASLDSVKYSISFDAFLMHIFFLYEKKAFVLFRGRFMKKARDFILNYVNPPFDPKINLLEVIEYIN